MIELYENENKIYIENYHKIREKLNRSDIQKANNYNEKYINYRGYTILNNKNLHIFLVKSQSSYRYYRTTITIKNNEIYDMDCNCMQYQNYKSCKHLAACFRYYSIQLFGKKKKPIEEISKILLEKYSTNNETIKKELKLNINIYPHYIENYYNEQLAFEFKITIGINKMYSLNTHFSSFKTAYQENTLKFGKELTYDPNIHYFNNSNKELIEHLLKHNYNMQYGYITEKELSNILPYISLPFKFDDHEINYINNKFPYKTSITKKESNYELSFNLENSINIYNKYIYTNGELYKLNKKEQELIKDLLESEIKTIKINENDFNKFTKGLLTIIKDNIEIDTNMKDELIIINEPTTKLYFDITNNEIKAKIILNYKEEINYFDETKNILRNPNYENNIINDLLIYGFILENKNIILNDLDKIVYFIENGLNELSTKYNIYTTENLKKLKIKKKTNITSMFSLGKDNIMSYNFNLDGINEKEITNILKNIKAKKKYYQLKNGDILNLEDDNLKELNQVVDDMEISDDEIIKANGTIQKYRALYLDSLKKTKYKYVETNSIFNDFITNFYKYKDSNINLDKKDLKILRDYQITGIKWLYNLDKTGFGGILADEMGLGKTIQIIYYIKEILKEEKTKFLIVVPTSLAYNWIYEFNKFANSIKTLLIVGNKKERIKKLNQQDNYDVIITTYGLLREDEELYLNYYYHTMIIDEAQNIKNYMAGISKTVKKIKAKTKFALTGTPIENSTLELWSIFDFIMPGYLSNIQKFQNKYKINDFNDETDTLINNLNNQIKPFILRRRKKDVIKELPEKLENNIFIDLSEEQKKLYISELETVKKKIDEIIKDEGIGKVRFMILQLLMKLRQICIDPSIIYEDYKGESNKIETLITIIKESINNNHKILVFTSFKTALNIVNQKLKKENIKTYIIDGQVKSKDRMERVENFNQTTEPSVFLIMLKSGGTGLNLTSADVVIHLDLWWNPQAENQATDRAHRIGQTNVVEVIKLITRGTIEEKILTLQEKKKKLSDKIIDGDSRNNNIISTLTENEIKNLLSFENKGI